MPKLSKLRAVRDQPKPIGRLTLELLEALVRSQRGDVIQAAGQAHVAPNELRRALIAPDQISVAVINRLLSACRRLLDMPTYLKLASAARIGAETPQQASSQPTQPVESWPVLSRSYAADYVALPVAEPASAPAQEPDALSQELGLKRCPKCGELKPRTLEFFYRRVLSPDGLQSYCKVCSNVWRPSHSTKPKQQNAPDSSDSAQLGTELRACLRCGEYKPWTGEFFLHSGGHRSTLSLSRLCRDCNRLILDVARAKSIASRKGAHAPDALPAPAEQEAVPPAQLQVALSARIFDLAVQVEALERANTELQQLVNELHTSLTQERERAEAQLSNAAKLAQVQAIIQGLLLPE